LIPDRYDDGGISGGTLERPAIQRLLQDIRDRQVDVVVVYKIDRLTRSLTDFSRIVEIFDAASVSFVSVTQQFNTTTSMGRLTLNVLLSFAQFEREVTAERIRDKIAASKKKGIWMGGTVSLGYQVQDRKLIVKEPEATFVRSLFDRYLQLRSVPTLSAELAREAIQPHLMSGPYPSVDGIPAYTRPIRSATLYKILSNPIYVGKLRHQQNIYDGEHEPIIDADAFAEVQALLAAQVSTPRGSAAKRDAHLLTGLLFDDTGDRMSPTHANKKGKRYRYYMSRRIINKKSTGAEGWRISARELESAVQSFTIHLLTDHSQLAGWIVEHASPGQTEYGLAAADAIARKLEEEQPTSDRQDLFKLLFQSITLTTTAIRFGINVPAIVRRLVVSEVESPSVSGADEVSSAPLILEMPISLKRRGNEQRLIIDSSFAPMRTPNAALIDLIAKAHLLFGKLTERPDTGITDVAKNLGLDRADVGRILPLAFLAPKIVEAVFLGDQSQSLSPRRLARMHLPLLWADQAAAIQ
jgi:DNA invertase Pin-like site-specific DNA recombinase